MKEVVLLIGHGSRDEEGNGQFLQAVRCLQERMPEQWIETCFLEFAAPDVQQGVDKCVAMGAERITAIPVLLLDAGHFIKDMPRELDYAGQRHPGVSMRYGRHLGLHENIFRLLLQVIHEAGEEPEVTEEKTALLMVGRGSSDAVANSNFYKMSRLLWERTSYATVENCFIGITRPTLDEGLQRCIRLGMEKVIVVPYFLFTGRLVKRIEEKVEEVGHREPSVQFVLTEYFGLQSLLLDVLQERVEEALRGDAVTAYCDNCRMRELAVGSSRYGEAVPHYHGHGHHHHGHGHHCHPGHDQHAQGHKGGVQSDSGEGSGTPMGDAAGCACQHELRESVR